MLQGMASVDMVTSLEITLNEDVEAPVKTSFIAVVFERPQMTRHWRTFHCGLHKSLNPHLHPTAIPSHPLLHMTSAPNSSPSPFSIKSTLPQQWLLFHKNNHSISISETSWTSANPHPAKSSWTSANSLLLKPCKIFRCPLQVRMLLWSLPSEPYANGSLVDFLPKFCCWDLGRIGSGCSSAQALRSGVSLLMEQRHCLCFNFLLHCPWYISLSLIYFTNWGIMTMVGP